MGPDAPVGVSPPSAGVRANSAARALNLIGDRWILMILRQAFLGVRRFEDFQGRIGLARSLLTDRLRRLEANGVMRRVRYQARPPRDEYRLTEMGLDLYDTALMLIRWEKRWHYDPAQPTHRLHHSCGRVFTPEYRCAACGEIVTARDVRSEDGPGAGFDPAQKPRAQRRSIVAGADLGGQDPMLERALQVLGDRWTAHVIAAAFQGHRRFGAFQRVLGVASNILGDRLARLTALGVLEKRVDPAQSSRQQYRLTPEGLDLFPLVLAQIRWGDRWLAGPEGPPTLIFHHACGQRLVGKITCDQCGEAVAARNTQLGPPLSLA
ncbi:MAG TPA: helix-turn-helix domain-containing protein [Caulobacteraceae bacterium]